MRHASIVDSGNECILGTNLNYLFEICGMSYMNTLIGIALGAFAGRRPVLWALRCPPLVPPCGRDWTVLVPVGPPALLTFMGPTSLAEAFQCRRQAVRPEFTQTPARLELQRSIQALALAGRCSDSPNAAAFLCSVGQRMVPRRLFSRC